MSRRGRPPGFLVPTGLPARLLAYFDANPGEELTHADAAAKFGVTHDNLHGAIEKLTRENRLQSIHVIRLPAKGRAE